MSDRLAEIEALVDAATPGPWEYAETEDGRAVVRSYQEDGTALVVCKADWGTFGDAALIAAAPTALRDLLAFAKEVRTALSDARGTPIHMRGPTAEALIEDVDAALANLEGGA